MLALALPCILATVACRAPLELVESLVYENGVNSGLSPQGELATVDVFYNLDDIDGMRSVTIRRTPLDGSPASPGTSQSWLVSDNPMGPIFGGAAWGEDGRLFVAGATFLHTVARDDVFTAGELGATVTGSPALGRDTVFIGAEDGVLHGFTQTYGTFGNASAGGAVPHGHPAVHSSGMVYTGWKGDGWQLGGLNVEAAEGVLEDTPTLLNSPAIDEDGNLLIAAYDGPEDDDPADVEKFLLQAYDQDVQLLWSSRLGGNPTATAVDQDGNIYIGCNGWEPALVSFDPAGVERWRYTELGGAGSPAIADDGRVFAGCGQALCVFDPATGELLDEFEATAPLLGAPVIQDGFVAAWLENGTTEVWDFTTDLELEPLSWARWGADNRNSGLER